jgi:hypothetical protein
MVAALQVPTTDKIVASAIQRPREKKSSWRLSLVPSVAGIDCLQLTVISFSPER